MSESLKTGVRRLNMEYLALVRKVDGDPINRNYVKAVLGLDDAAIDALRNLSSDEMALIADVGITLFRLKLHDLMSAQSYIQQGDFNKVASLLAAGLVADCGKELET